jgi:hypothetical protein
MTPEGRGDQPARLDLGGIRRQSARVTRTVRAGVGRTSLARTERKRRGDRDFFIKNSKYDGWRSSMPGLHRCVRVFSMICRRPAAGSSRAEVVPVWLKVSVVGWQSACDTSHLPDSSAPEAGWRLNHLQRSRRLSAPPTRRRRNDADRRRGAVREKAERATARAPDTAAADFVGAKYPRIRGRPCNLGSGTSPVGMGRERCPTPTGWGKSPRLQAPGWLYSDRYGSFKRLSLRLRCLSVSPVVKYSLRAARSASS